MYELYVARGDTSTSISHIMRILGPAEAGKHITASSLHYPTHDGAFAAISHENAHAKALP